MFISSLVAKGRLTQIEPTDLKAGTELRLPTSTRGHPEVGHAVVMGRRTRSDNRK